MGLFNMSGGQGMGQPGQPMPAPFDPMQGQSPSLFNFSTPQAISNPVAAKPKHNWAGIASSFLAGVTGRPDSYMKSVEDRRKEAMDLAQTQREQAAKFAQFQREWDYQAANPKPEVDPVTRDANAYMGLDPAHRAAYDQMHPGQIVNTTLPDGRFYSGPAAGLAAALAGGGQPSAPPSGPPPGVTFTPLNNGGQTHPASGNFLRR